MNFVFQLFQWFINDRFRWTRTGGHPGLPAVFPRASGVGLSSRSSPGTRQTRRFRKRLQRMCQSWIELRGSTDIPRRTEVLGSSFLCGRRGAYTAGAVFPESGRSGCSVCGSGFLQNGLYEGSCLLNLRPWSATKRRCCIWPDWRYVLRSNELRLAQRLSCWTCFERYYRSSSGASKL